MAAARGVLSFVSNASSSYEYNNIYDKLTPEDQERILKCKLVMWKSGKGRVTCF